MGLAFLLSIASDISLSPHRLADTVPMYGALALHAIASDALERTNNISIPKLGYELTMAANLLGASVLALPLYLIRTIMVCVFRSHPFFDLSRCLAGISGITWSIIGRSGHSSSHDIFSIIPCANYLTDIE